MVAWKILKDGRKSALGSPRGEGLGNSQTAKVSVIIGRFEQKSLGEAGVRFQALEFISLSAWVPILPHDQSTPIISAISVCNPRKVSFLSTAGDKRRIAFLLMNEQGSEDMSAVPMELLSLLLPVLH